MRRARRHVLGIALAPLAAVVMIAPGGADDPLDQQIDRDQAVAAGRVVLDGGHVDIGPRLAGGSWTLMVHDDAAIPAVWRDLDTTVVHVRDDALQTVPDDPTYAFVGVEPGTDVHVVPQVQRPGVVWVGWNTQEPDVMAAIDRGVTLTLLGVDGPGEMVVYLQAGILGEPDVLWRSTVDEPQPLWVEVNTHTHANWVFTEPGVYLVTVRASADLVDGTQAIDERVLRFAVGDEADLDRAFGAAPMAAPTPADGTGPAGTAEAGGPGGTSMPNDGGGLPVAAVAVGLAGVTLLTLVSVVGVRSGRARRRADDERGRAITDVSA